jgi:hypothetical protein
MSNQFFISITLLKSRDFLKITTLQNSPKIFYQTFGEKILNDGFSILEGHIIDFGFSEF